jgi:hypothetical protein
MGEMRWRFGLCLSPTNGSSKSGLAKRSPAHRFGGYRSSGWFTTFAPHCGRNLSAWDEPTVGIFARPDSQSSRKYSQ